MISNVGILCVKSQLYLQSSTGIDFYRSIAHEISIWKWSCCLKIFAQERLHVKQISGEKWILKKKILNKEFHLKLAWILVEQVLELERKLLLYSYADPIQSTLSYIKKKNKKQKIHPIVIYKCIVSQFAMIFTSGLIWWARSRRVFCPLWFSLSIKTSCFWVFEFWGYRDLSFSLIINVVFSGYVWKIDTQKLHVVINGH